MRFVSPRLFGVLVFITFAANPIAPALAQSELPRLEMVAADADFPLQVSGPRYQRGYLVVAQDSDSPDGLELRLPVIRVRAVDPEPGLAPVVFLPGGPGEGGLRAAQYPGAYQWTQNRDFIVFGRRGTRFAMPSLQCEALGPALAATGEAAQSELFAALDSCKDGLTSQGVDLNQFHSAASARDIDDLREVLGEEKLALFALSYGTRLALTYAREFPDRVEAMVLDSPLPHSARFDDEYPANLETVLRRVAQICESDDECSASYPDLERRYFSAVASATEACHSAAGEGRVCPTDLVGRVPVYSAETFAEAPRRMEHALAASKPLASPNGAADFDWGVRLSVWCSEALPFAARANGPVPDSFAGLDGAVFTPGVCERWGVTPRPDDEVEPTFSAIPTLILAGELDALTPPRWGVQAAQTLSASRLISIPGGFHSETTNWSGDGCAMSLAVAFFENPQSLLESPREPDCIEARRYPRFVTPQ